jgi:tricarballylate dehydrogenase
VTHTEFDPSVKDGKHTEGVNPPKSNWALPVAVPPLVAYPVTCGITFTFGGLRVDREARVLDTAGRPVPGLYAAGETVGGVFYHNYPGGSGLALGAVLGRVAGAGAARFAAAGPRRSGRPGGAGPGTHP